MIDYQSLVESRLSPVGDTSKDIIYRCPFCDDRSGHLYIDYNSEKYHCFKCEEGGSLRYLLRRLGISITEDTPRFLRDKSLSTSSQLESLLRFDTQEDVERLSVDFYYRYHTKELSPEARNYLHWRGLDDSVIDSYHLMEGIDRFGDVTLSPEKGMNYSGRIMIPSIRDNLIRFYVARDYTGSGNPKYLNPPSRLVKASEDVWNLQNARSRSSTVIICEGVFTAIAAGGSKMNAVATYGKSISDSKNGVGQGRLLLDAKFSTYILAYDSDARKDMYEACKYLYDRGAKVKYLLVPPSHGRTTDISDLSKEEYQRVLSNVKEFTSESRISFLLEPSL